MTDKAKKEKIRQIMHRKEDHINICLEKPVQARHAKNLFDDIKLVNNSLPEINFDSIDTSITFLGHRFSAPIMVGAMTGGAELAKKINRNVAEAAQELGLGMVVGSQRAGLYDRVLSDTYSVARKAAPDIFIGSNIGGAQISAGLGAAEAKKLIDMLDADALYIHLNPAQEIIQPEGDARYSGVLSGIRKIAESVDKPVVAKEVGFGISGSVAQMLEKAGVAAIEVAGMGGTSYTAIEHYRAANSKMHMKDRMGVLFWDWGIPTAASLYSVRKAVSLPLVSSGGIRNGTEVAKSIVMGASMCATAWPVLKPACTSAEAVKETLEEFIYALKCTMFLTGCRNMKELACLKYAAVGELREWMDSGL